MKSPAFIPARCATWRSASCQKSNRRGSRPGPLGPHLDRAARAFGLAQPAALAIVVVDLEALARTQLHHGVVGAHPVAVVALEAVAARQAAPRLVERGVGV